MTPEELQDLRVLPQFPKTAEELIVVAGLHAAARLISSWPGAEFPCPVAFSVRSNVRGQRRYEQLAEIVGDHAARRIVSHWGGRILSVPNCKDAIWARTQDKIRAHYDRLTGRGNDYSHAEAIFEIGITYNITGRGVELVLSRPDNQPGNPEDSPDESQLMLF